MTCLFLLLTAPILPMNIVAAAVPGETNTVRLQWDYPGRINSSLTLGQNNGPSLRLTAKWSNLLDNGHSFLTWHRSASGKSVDLTRTRHIILRNLPSNGLFRFKVWITDVNKSTAKFPVLVKNFVSTGTASSKYPCRACVCVHVVHDT